MKYLIMILLGAVLSVNSFAASFRCEGFQYESARQVRLDLYSTFDPMQGMKVNHKYPLNAVTNFIGNGEPDFPGMISGEEWVDAQGVRHMQLENFGADDLGTLELSFPEPALETFKTSGSLKEYGGVNTFNFYFACAVGEIYAQ